MAKKLRILKMFSFDSPHSRNGQGHAIKTDRCDKTEIKKKF